jgi:hypothetical protein
MSAVTIACACAVIAVVVAAVTFAAFDLAKIGARRVDRLKARRACRRGWDWAAFERELAGYARSRSVKR